MAEGSIWEALDKASYYQLSNLIAIVDVNRLGQRGPTELGWDLDAYAAPRRGVRRRARWSSTATTSPRSTRRLPRPSAGDAGAAHRHPGQDRQGPRLLRGRGQAQSWHGKPFPPDMAERAIAELGGERNLVAARAAPPEPPAPAASRAGGQPTPPPARRRAQYDVGDEGRHPQGLRRRAAPPSAPATARSWRSTARSATPPTPTSSRKRLPGPLLRDVHRRAADGRRGGRARPSAATSPFASTFAAFFTRAYDFIRMGAISGRRPAAGRLARRRGDRRRRPVADGAGGPGHDARRARLHRAVPERRHQHRRARRRRWPPRPGISYLRTTRGAYPVLYGARRGLPGRRLQGPALQRRRPGDADRRRRHPARVPRAPPTSSPREGIAARVIDCYSVKPIDTATLVAAADATGGPDRGRRGPPPRGRPRLRRRRRAARRRAAPAPARPPRRPRACPAPAPATSCSRWAGIDADHIAAAARDLRRERRADREQRSQRPGSVSLPPSHKKKGRSCGASRATGP